MLKSLNYYVQVASSSIDHKQIKKKNFKFTNALTPPLRIQPPRINKVIEYVFTPSFKKKKNRELRWLITPG